jgi:hypothetical protein
MELSGQHGAPVAYFIFFSGKKRGTQVKKIFVYLKNKVSSR